MVPTGSSRSECNRNTHHRPPQCARFPQQVSAAQRRTHGDRGRRRRRRNRPRRNQKKKALASPANEKTRSSRSIAGAAATCRSTSRASALTTNERSSRAAVTSWRRERANLFTRRVRCETRPWRRSSRATAARVLSRATVRPCRGEGRRSLRAAPPLRCDLLKYLGEVVSREAQHALLLPVRGERAEVVPGSSRAARWWHVRNAEWCGRPSSPRWSSTARRW